MNYGDLDVHAAGWLCVVWDSVAEVAQVGRRCDWLARRLALDKGRKYVMCI